MSDEQLLLAALWPLASGRNAREAEAWGVRLTGPECIERLAHGERRKGLRQPSGRPWRGLVRDGEDVVVRDVLFLGWTLVEMAAAHVSRDRSDLLQAGRRHRP